MKKLLLAAGLIALGILPGRAEDLQTVLGKMAEREKSISAVRFEFKQDVKFFAMSSTAQVSGVALFKKGGKMRVEKKKPEEQTTISNGKKVWVYSPAFNQAWEGKWQGWLQASSLPKGVVPLQDYVRELQREFNLSLKDQTEAGFVTVAGTPKNQALDYKLELKVSRTTWMPVQTVFESDSAKIVTSLLSTEINPSAPDSLFTFTPPAGTDVISMN